MPLIQDFWCHSPYYETNLGIPPKDASVEHVHNSRSCFEGDFDERAWATQRGRGLSIWMNEFDCGQTVQLSPDVVEAGVSQVDAMVIAGDSETIRVELI